MGGTSYEQAQSEELSLKLNGGVAFLTTASLTFCCGFADFMTFERLFI